MRESPAAAPLRSVNIHHLFPSKGQQRFSAIFPKTQVEAGSKRKESPWRGEVVIQGERADIILSDPVARGDVIVPPWGEGTGI
jgi:hypothetical protein